MDATPDIHIQDQLTTQAPYLPLPPPRLREDLTKEVPDRPPRLHLEEHLYHRRHKRLLQTIKGRKVHMPKSKWIQKKKVTGLHRLTSYGSFQHVMIITR